jgi:hypothetical protein
MPSRSLTRRMAALIPLLVPCPTPAREALDPALRGWLSSLVTRIDVVDRSAPPPALLGATGVADLSVPVELGR